MATFNSFFFYFVVIHGIVLVRGDPEIILSSLTEIKNTPILHWSRHKIYG
jgi:hypothetical protein